MAGAAFAAPAIALAADSTAAVAGRMAGMISSAAIALALLALLRVGFQMLFGEVERAEVLTWVAGLGVMLTAGVIVSQIL